MDRMDNELNSLLSAYRDACRDREPTANFMAELWSKIETRRSVAVSLWLRKWTEAWLLATVVLAVVIGVFLIPGFQDPPVLEAHYVDVLSAADSAGDLAMLLRGELE